jgi:hypothetical protein
VTRQELARLAVEKDVRESAVAAAAAARTGVPVAVRTSATSTVRGTVEWVHFKELRWTRGGTCQALFTVRLVGPNGARHNVTVRRIPR